MQKPKPTRSFRISEDLINKAKQKGLNITEIFEAALAKALQDKRCPYCGQDIKK